MAFNHSQMKSKLEMAENGSVILSVLNLRESVKHSLKRVIC